MQPPDAVRVWCADGTAQQDVEGSEVSGGVGVGRKQVVRWQPCCVQRAMVACKASEGFGVLNCFSSCSNTAASSRRGGWQ